jgi:hypothetical protein
MMSSVASMGKDLPACLISTLSAHPRYIPNLHDVESASHIQENSIKGICCCLTSITPVLSDFDTALDSACGDIPFFVSTITCFETLCLNFTDLA